MIRCKRVYLEAEACDGQRVLVDRLWPRGLAKDALACDAWLPDVAPSTTMRKGFGHRAHAFAQLVKAVF